MNTIPKDPDPRILMYLTFAEFRRHNPNDTDIASKFHHASAKDVFGELKGYGFPVCEVCGATPVVGEHCKTSKRPPKPRSAKGERRELPSVKNAATIFRDTIATLEVYLEHMLSLKESRQGGYYIDEGETEEDNVREARGGQWHPHPQLVVLIGAYVLEHCVYASERGDDWGSILRLLNKLHPRPSEANRQQLAQYLYGRQRLKNGKLVPEGDGFLNRARQIAALMRGEEEIGSGVKNRAISSFDQLWAWDIELLVEQGLSREEILKRKREELERWKVETRQSVLEELEQAKQTLDEDEFACESHDAHEYLQQLAEETFDEDEFDRRWDLRRDLT